MTRHIRPRRRRVAACPDSGDSVDHAQLAPRPTGIMCGTGGGGLEQPVGGTSTYWVLEADEEVDALHTRAVAAGARSLMAPYGAEYGGRHCSVRDPDGNLWSFGSHRGEGT